MKILYTTDLHGANHYYNLIWEKAKEYQVDMVINGADMLPKIKPIFKRQLKFMKFLENHYWPLFEKAGIHYLCCLGNDDLRIYDQAFDEVCDEFEFVHNIAQRKIQVADIEFIGFNLVADYPFELKDRCRMDHDDFVFPRQFGPGCFSSDKNGGCWEDIEDWFSLARSLPTMEDELKALVRPENMKKAVYVIHMPPENLGLDVCANGDRPASKSVYNFLLDNQPMLSLHGHIHESYRRTGIWNVLLGETICVQPGQGGADPVYVIIDTDDLFKMTRSGHATETLMVDGYFKGTKIGY